MEAFSDMIALFKLNAKIYNNAQFCGNWQVNEHALGQTCFHLVTVGDCIMHISNEQPIHLFRGDLVIFPRETEHRLCPNEQSVAEMEKRAIDPHAQGTGLLCGQLIFEHHAFDSVLDLLPNIVVIKNEHAPWLAPLLMQIEYESVNRQSGSDAILNRLAELLFVYALRHILQNQTDLSFLGLYVSNSLKAAIQLIHQQPHTALPLDKLAEACSMSRTVFAQTFKANSGWTPAQYITWWRMQLAWGKLEQGERISLVATDVGYQSEAAFSRVFKKIFGMSPGRVRGKSLA
jgi:AraC-like DNA-binding protein|tara:strand:- start:1429 stop:2295 length:867 start_codon:yes stop_codon:yes gene_type:complete